MTNAEILKQLNYYNSAFKFPSGLLVEIARKESQFNPKALNKYSGAMGLMQLMPVAVAEILRLTGKKVDPYNPAQAIWGAGVLLLNYHTRLKSWALTIAAYNWGIGNIKKHVANYGVLTPAKLPGETRNYLAIVGGKIGVTV